MHGIVDNLPSMILRKYRLKEVKLMALLLALALSIIESVALTFFRRIIFYAYELFVLQFLPE